MTSNLLFGGQLEEFVNNGVVWSQYVMGVPVVTAPRPGPHGKKEFVGIFLRPRGSMIGGTIVMTPDEAREVAQSLVALADVIDAA